MFRGWFGRSGGDAVSPSSSLRVLRQGKANRVVFFYPGEEGTCVDHAMVTLYENGIVHIKAPYEETTTHLQNVEILWHYVANPEDKNSKFRVLSFKKGDGPGDEPSPQN